MKLLWIAFVWPEPRSSAAGYRTLELLENVRAAGYEVTVCSPCQPNQHQDALIEAGFTTIRFEANDSAFDEYLRSSAPDIVVFDRFIIEEQFSWRVKEQLPETIRVLDSIDLHSLRRVRQNNVEAKNGRGISNSDLPNEDFLGADFFREIASILRCDLTLLISDFEAAFLQHRFNVDSDMFTVCRYSTKALPEVPTFEERRDLVIIGNFNHPPNIDAVRLLQSELWPAMKQRLAEGGDTDAELHVYGAYPPANILQLDSPQQRFRVKGRAADAQATLARYRINLAPLRFGAGIKGKVSDGWAAGTPCVGTSVAAEGMSGELAFGGSVADSWPEFVGACADLYANEPRWTSQQQNGFKILQERFDSRQNKQIFLMALTNASNKKAERRAANFFGAMLWHHQFRSTEFFSRWIESKNNRDGYN